MDIKLSDKEWFVFQRLVVEANAQLVRFTVRNQMTETEAAKRAITMALAQIVELRKFYNKTEGGSDE